VGHGIRDFSAAQNLFGGGGWIYTLNTNVVENAVVINEIMFHPSSERTDEEYVELYNSGAGPINLDRLAIARRFVSISECDD
jgi:hypothetical protein